MPRRCATFRLRVPLFATVLVAVILVSTPQALAQGYVPISPDRGDGSPGLYSTIAEPARRENLGLGRCDPAPTVEEVRGTLRYHTRLLASSAAAKIGLGFLSGQGGRNTALLVRDYFRGTTCLSSDGTETLIYGQTIRTVFTLEDYDGEFGLSLPVIAANSTINRKSHQVHIDVIGFANPRFNEVLADISGKEFNVETYHEYLEIQSRLIAMIDDPATTQTVHRLGVVPERTDDALQDSVATTFALAQIARGSGCFDAKSRIVGRSVRAADVVDGVYLDLVGVCGPDAPSGSVQAKAKELLLGLRIR